MAMDDTIDFVEQFVENLVPQLGANLFLSRISRGAKPNANMALRQSLPADNSVDFSELTIPNSEASPHIFSFENATPQPRIVVQHPECGDFETPNCYHTQEDIVNTMPNNIMMKIFAHLNIKTKLKIVPLVCRRWNELSKNSRLYQRVDIKNIQLNNKKLMSLLKFLHLHRPQQLLLLNLTEKGNNILADFWEMMPYYCSNLQLLYIKKCHVAEESFINIVKRASNLTRLILVDEKNITNNVIKVVSTHLPRLQLFRLDFKGHQTNLTSDCLLHMAGGLPALQHLYLKLCFEILDNSLAKLLQVHGQYLDSLHFHAGQLREDCLEETIQQFHNCSKLRILDLNSPEVKCLQSICDDLNVEQLYIRTLPRFVLNVSKWANLRNLQIVKPIDFPESVLIDICSKAGATLETLDLRNIEADISDSTIDAIVGNCRNLLVLQLIDCRKVRPDTFLEYHLSSMMPRLLLLNLYGCQFSLGDEEVFRNLSWNNPNTTIITLKREEMKLENYGVPLHKTKEALKKTISSSYPWRHIF